MPPKTDLPAVGTVRNLTVEGVPVRVRTDTDGRVLSVGAGYWAGDTASERLAKMAITLAKGAVEAHSARSRGGLTHAKDPNTANEVAYGEARQWLSAAYDSASTRLGHQRLVTNARKLLAETRPEMSADERRHLITEARARRFLRDKD